MPTSTASTLNHNRFHMAERPEIDRWILSLLNTLVKNVSEDLDNYESNPCCARAISTFVLDNLSNWYVRLNRKRFWGGSLDQDKLAAYQTLYTCLLTVAKTYGPDCSILRRPPLPRPHPERRIGTTSPHSPCATRPLSTRPRNAHGHRPTTHITVLSLRKKANIKVRQPLVMMLVPANDEKTRSRTSMP